jgi:hypothetical protein
MVSPPACGVLRKALKLCVRLQQQQQQQQQQQRRQHTGNTSRVAVAAPRAHRQ